MIERDAAKALGRAVTDLRALLDDAEQYAQPLGKACGLIHRALRGGGKLMACGNGGSAADAAHFTAEFAGRYVLNRRGYPAIDLTADHSLLTALINDYPPAEVFARQVRALGKRGDVLAVFTTSGNSANVKLALDEARQMRIKTVAFLGRDGGVCRGRADVQLIVPGVATARIQELHQLLYHTICETLDPLLARADGRGSTAGGAKNRRAAVGSAAT